MAQDTKARHSAWMLEAWSVQELAHWGAPIPKHRLVEIVVPHRGRRLRKHQTLAATTFQEPEHKAAPPPDPSLGDPRFPRRKASRP